MHVLPHRFGKKKKKKAGCKVRKKDKKMCLRILQIYMKEMIGKCRVLIQKAVDTTALVEEAPTMPRATGR